MRQAMRIAIVFIPIEAAFQNSPAIKISNNQPTISFCLLHKNITAKLYYSNYLSS